MEKEVKVLFYLKKNERKKNGNCPIMAKLSIGKVFSTVFSIKVSVPEKLWAGGRATGKSHTAASVNNELDTIRGNAVKYYRELSAIRNEVLAEDIKYHLQGMVHGQETLLTYFRTHNENFDKRIGVNREKSSAKSYWLALSHLADFVKEEHRLSDIPLQALDRSFIDKFDIYLKTDCGLAPGTIVLLITRLKTIIGNAMAEGLLTRDPFAGYEPERPKPRQKYLTRQELDKLMAIEFSEPRYYLIRDLFLFSCFTGIPYCDMCKLSEEDISIAGDGTVWIRTYRKKTGVDYDVPLLDLPLQILRQYKGKAPGGRLLPMYSISHLNVELKKIARVCGIDRPISFHMARHTYATEITLSQGVPIETVSRMLGHTSISTTQIYAKITNDKIDEDMKALEKRIAGRFRFAI